MKKSEENQIGERLRYLRKEILRLTQAKLAEEINVSPSLIAMQELGKQQPSRAHLIKLQERYGVNMQWVVLGDGEPLSADTNSYQSVEKPKHKFTKGEVSALAQAGQLLISSAVPGIPIPDKFGYLYLTGTPLRMQAARDKRLQGTNLFKIFEDDTIWAALGEPTGLEMEAMRSYLEYGDDRTIGEWLECFRFFRWANSCMEAVGAVHLVQLAKIA